MKSRPLITVAIAVYNTEKYLKDCMESVVNQTYRNLEIICVNDASTDSSLVMLESYASRDARIKIITNEKNSGLGVTRNVGMDAAHGEYILFIDSDDWIELTTCEKLLESALKNMSDLVFYSAYEICGKQKIRLAGCPKVDAFKELNNASRRLFFSVLSTTWSKFWKVEFMKASEIRFPNRRRGQDQLPKWIAYLTCRKVSIVDAPLYYHRSHPEQITKMGDSRSMSIIEVYDDIEKELKKRCFFTEFQELFWSHKINTFYQIYETLNDDLKDEFIKKINLTKNEKKFLLFRMKPFRQRSRCLFLINCFRYKFFIKLIIFIVKKHRNLKLNNEN